MFRKAAMALALICLAGPAPAHEAKGVQGGRVADAGEYHVELVVKDALVEVHVRDHADKPVPTAGFKGLAILAVGGKSQRIVLAADGESRLTGKAPVALPQAPKGVVQITPPNGKTVSGRYQ